MRARALRPAPFAGLGVGVAAAVLVAVAALAACAREVAEGGSLEVDGRNRSWVVRAPQDRAGPLPLVVSLHGGGTRAARSDRVTRVTALAEQGRAIVALPEGFARSWNDGRGDDSTVAARAGIDDVGFLTAMVDAISRSHDVDRARVYAVGISNGAMMSLRLVCERPDVFAGAAAVAGSLPAALQQTCRPGPSTRVLVVHGDADPLVPYGGGEVRVGGDDRGEVVGAPATADLFAGKLGCGDPADEVGAAPGVPVRAWTECPSGAAVALATVEGGGHTWPGGPQYLPEGRVGPVDDDLDATSYLWDFLQG